MTKTPQWLPDGSGIDPLTIDPKTVVEVEWPSGVRTAVYNGEGGFKVGARDVSNSCPWGDGRIVRVFADVTPPKPDPRVEVVARALAAECGSDTWQAWASNSRSVLAALDTMDPDPEQWER